MGSQKKSSPTQVDPLRPEFRGLSSDLGSYARSLVGKSATPYTGSLTTVLSPEESDILRRSSILADNPTGPAQSFSPIDTNFSLSPLINIPGQNPAYSFTDVPTAPTTAFQSGRDALISDILSGRRLSPSSNPYLDAIIGDITKRSNEGLAGNLNLVDAAFARSGMNGRSSGRSGEAIEASRRAGADLSGQIANILGTNYQQGLQEQLATLSQILPQIDTSNLARYSTVAGVNLNNDLARANYGTTRDAAALDRARTAIDQNSSRDTLALNALLSPQQLRLQQEQVAGNYGLARSGQELSSLAQILGMQALPRQVQQANQQAMYQEFLRQLAEPLQYTMSASQILANQPGFQHTNPSYEPMPFWQQALLGGISGASAGGTAALLA